MKKTPVVTVFLRHQGEILLLQRSEKVGSYSGRWGTVTGHVENNDPLASALQELNEETGLTEADVSLVCEGASFSVDDPDRDDVWTVHPFLFDAATRDVSPNWETDTADWASPTVLLRRNTVPELWRSYRQVAPSVASISDDDTHGSAWLSMRALEVLRDRAAVLGASNLAPEETRAKLVDTARRLTDARPSMSALATRVGRVMQTSRPALTAPAVEVNAHDAIAQAVRADADAAACAAEAVAGRRVLTLSRSGTVLQALRDADPAPSVVVAVSEPGREGIPVAEALAGDERDVTLIADSAVAAVLARGEVEAVLVGADAVLPSGAVINKVGTRGAALAAREADVPVYVATSTDKVCPVEEAHGEAGNPRTLYNGPADVHVDTPLFDVTPGPWITGGYCTDDGLLDRDDIEAVAERNGEVWEGVREQG